MSLAALSWRGTVWRATSVALAVAAILSGSGASADEFSLIPDSTVIGRNFGAPTATGSQGRTPVGTVDFVTEAAFFFKNLELVGVGGDDLLGETFIGFRVPLRFRFRAHERLDFEIGALIGHDFGDDDALNVVAPIVRLTWEAARDLFVIGGTLFPTHWIGDPILDDVQKFRAATEQGFQMRVDWRHWKQDLWINWRMREGSVSAEEFEVGNSTRIALWDERIWLDGHLLWDHAGGQVSLSEQLDNNLAILAGGSYGQPRLFGVDWLEELRLGARYLYSTFSSRDFEDSTGSGWEVGLSLDTRPLDNLLVRLHASWFEGDDFLSLRGDPLYRLDEYQQYGIALLFEPFADLFAEGAFVLQRTDGELNYSFHIALSWGKAFAIPFLRPR